MIVRPTRRTQPYAKGRRRPLGRALAAMKRGRPARLPHPMDTKRRSARRRRRRAY